jgi:transcriptional regulator with XRE-family HTH domain
MARATQGSAKAASGRSGRQNAASAAPQSRDWRQANMLAIAQRIRAARRRKQISLDNLATRVGLNKGYLSRIERGLQAPSVSTLLNIAATLDIEVARLFGETTKPDAITLVRRDQHVKMDSGAADAPPYEALLPGSAHRRMSVFKIDPPRGAASEKAGHMGDELIYVLAGAIEIVFGDRRVTLEEGDAVHFEGDLKHQIRTIGDAPASALVIVANDLADARRLAGKET